MWPINKKRSQGLPSVLPFRDGQAFFEYQCKFGHTELKANQGIVALVLDAKKEFNTPVAVKIETDGRQLAVIRVASDDGGFVIPAYTPSGSGDRLQPGDVVIWVPSTFNAKIGQGMSDRRAGWVGFIRAKIAPEMSTTSNNMRVLCEYN